MKKLISICTALVIAVTVFSVPMSASVFGEEGATEDPVLSQEIETTEIKQENVKLSETKFIYDNGKPIEPEIIVSVDGFTLEKGVDYEVKYVNNKAPGKAQVVITGIGSYTGNVTKDFEIIKKTNLSECKVSISKINWNYTGKYIRPAVKVTHKGSAVDPKNYDLTYEKNIYPGVAEITVTGKETFTGKLQKSFNIAKASGLKVNKYGRTSLQLKWNRSVNVTGYKIYSYSFANKKWVLKKTIIGNDKNYCTIEGLRAGYGYKFKVKTYVKADSKNYLGSDSNILYAPTIPSTVKLKSLNTKPTLYITAKWGKRAGSGYQVRISKNSNFTKYTTYNIKSSGQLSKSIGKLSDKTTYYVKVRAYKTYSGKTVYGSWSNTKKVKTNGNGWFYSGGQKYYYKGGNKYFGSKTIDGEKYYFRKDTGALVGPSQKMWSKVKDQASGTEYLISTSRDMNITCVYQGSKGNWKLKYYWKCTTGADATRTPGGRFSIPETKTKLSHFGSGYTCWYATRFYKRCYFHSVVYNYQSMSSVQDGRLGGNLSHGCIRLAINNAKWIYDNIEPGTKVVIY